MSFSAGFLRAPSTEVTVPCGRRNVNYTETLVNFPSGNNTLEPAPTPDAPMAVHS